MRALESLDGVIRAQVSFPDKVAVVHFRKGRVEPEQMRQALLRAGFAGDVLSEKL